MNRIKLAIRELNIPFTLAFKHSSAERRQTQSIVVSATNRKGQTGYGESCPRNYVTGETVASARAFFDTHREAISRGFQSLEQLKNWIEMQKLCIGRNPAAWCAIELALLDLMAKERHISVETLLGLSKLLPYYQYSAVLGDNTIDRFSTHFLRYQALQFTDYKIKLSGDFDNDQEKIRMIRESSPATTRIRADANNLWNNVSEACDYLSALQYPLFAIEEPLVTKDIKQLSKLGHKLSLPIILDESFLNSEDLEQIKNIDFKNCILNLRLSKLGGLCRSLSIAKRARELRLPVIVGAHVGETSLLTRAGLTLATAVSGNLFAIEGAFGTHLLKYDICPKSMTFGAEGILKTSTCQLTSDYGFGLAISIESSASMTMHGNRETSGLASQR